MLTQTITAPAVQATKVFPAPRAQNVPAADQFSVIATVQV
jgi:CRP/FNR family nitrogen fixation transcriptional regulator